MIDLHSKKMINYHFSRQMIIDLIIQAVKKAYVSQKPKDKVILQTDLGSQYTSQEIKDLTSDFNIIQSCSCKGCPYDHACIESFHATLRKKKCIKHLRYFKLGCLISIYRGGTPCPSRRRLGIRR